MHDRATCFSPREKVGETRRSRAPRVSFPSPRGRGWLAAGALTCRAARRVRGHFRPLLRRSPHCLHHLEGKKRWGVRHPSAKQEWRAPTTGPIRPDRLGAREGRPYVPHGIFLPVGNSNVSRHQHLLGRGNCPYSPSPWSPSCSSRLMKKGVAAGLSRHRALNPKEIWRGKPAATPRQSPISSAC